VPYYWRSWEDPPGYDINRDYHANLDFVLGPDTAHLLPGEPRGTFGYYLTPEARMHVELYKELRPNFYISLHHRSSAKVNNKLTYLSLHCRAINDPGYTDQDGIFWPLDPEVTKLGQQACALVYHALSWRGLLGHVDRYVECGTPFAELPGCEMGVFSLNGTGVMLYELRGRIGQKAGGIPIRQICIGIYETLLAFATGEIYNVDPSLYYEIPVGERAANPRF
jgi:hypothetical protein